MNVLWSYFWPCFAIGLVIGVLVGVFAFHRWPRRKRNVALGSAAVTAIALTLIWHGPLGGADRFASRVERNARQALNYYEVPRVHAALHRGPLSRRLILAGPADDFQRSELPRLFSQLPGVSKAQWGTSPGGVPLMLEGSAITIVGLLFGLLLAYLIELHRRYNAQWSW